jgi:hypothetical protein
LLETLDKLSAYELLLSGKGWMMKSETEFDLMNGVLAARKDSRISDRTISRIVENIERQSEQEGAARDYVPYNLFYLTGTYVLLSLFFDMVRPRPELKAEFRDSMFAHFMKDSKSSGFGIAAFYNYRRPGQHWSERQNFERFLIG